MSSLAFDRCVGQAFMVASFIGTILIITIHYNTRQQLSIKECVDFNFLLQEFLSNGIARVAVPVFSFMSGLFYFTSWVNRLSTLAIFERKIRTIFVPYLIASTFFFVISEISNVLHYGGTKCDFSFVTILTKLLFHPLSPQFWYLRDLLILIVAVPLISLFGRKLCLVLVVILFYLWLFNIQIFPLFYGWYFLNIETLFFFIAGWFFSSNDMEITRIMDLRNWVFFCLIAVWLLLIAARIIIDPNLVVWYVERYTLASLLLYKVSIVIGVVLLFALSYRLRGNKVLLYLSGFSFFIYLYHLFPISHFTRNISCIAMGEAYSFYLSVPLSFFVVLSFAYVLSVFWPSLFVLLTGGRKPEKRFR